jgi:hypothetical protein
MDRNGRLHTHLRFATSLPVALALLESVEGAPTPIGEKKRNEKTSQPTKIGLFWMHSNRHLHTYFGFTMLLPGALPWLESVEGVPAPIDEKRRNWKTSQPTTIGQFWMHRNGRLHTYLRFAMSLPGSLALLENPEGAYALIGEKERNAKTSQPRTIVPFLMHRKRRLHTCFHSPVSLTVSVAWL